MTIESVMKFIITSILFIAGLVSIQTPDSPEKDVRRSKEEPIWSTAYLASWQHDAGTPYSNWGVLRSSDIDWSSITHLIYFALDIGPDGTPTYSFDPEERRNFNSDRLNDIVSAAHRNDTKILFSVGGAGNYDNFSSSIRTIHRKQFIETIVNIISTYGFDGVDLDMEPIRERDFNNYLKFVKELHERLAHIRTRHDGIPPLITIAALKGYDVLRIYGLVQNYVSQINIMTYDMAQPWRGWQAWHNSALFSENIRFDYNNAEMSSVHQKVQLAKSAGIESRKLGIGIDFYGYIWHGVHLLEKWANWPLPNHDIIERPGGVPYYELRERFDLSKASWDPRAKTSYLNIQNPKTFVSFDNEHSIREKVQYAIDEGLGGVMIWELGGGFVGNKTTNTPDPLLKAVKSQIFSQSANPR